jgi:glycosyltransferase involved in cell wall biosynthesis
MPTRNGGKFIHEQLESILTQIGPRDEVIISDDSSTDDTVTKIATFHDERIILLEGNRFFSPVFNIENALKRASGDIIILSDQDDVWVSNRMEVIKRELSLTRSIPRLIVLDGVIVDEHDTIIRDSIFAHLRSGKGLAKNIYDNTYMGCCMAFSRSLLDIALPFPKRIPMHDVWLGLLAECFGEVLFVKANTLRYRKHSASVTTLHRQWDIKKQVLRRYHLVVALVTRTVAIKAARARGR